MRLAVSIAIASSAAGLLAPAIAAACSPAMPPAPTATPRAGSTAVSTATSLIIIAPSQPSEVTLTAGGVAVPIDGVTLLGSGIDGGFARTQFWRVRMPAASDMLAPSSEHVLSLALPPSARATVTTFTTAAGYDKQPGTAATLRGIQLWRVRYPVSLIAAGSCIFAEYHGFIALDYDPASIPDTPPSSVVSTIRLAPRTGGLEQAFMFTGPDGFKGGPPTNDLSILPSQVWLPDLDPSREYCAGISSFGYGDLARLPVNSAQACARVTEIDLSNAAPGTTPPDAGRPGDVLRAPSGGGCTVAGVPAGGAPAAIAVLLGALAVAATIRRRRGSPSPSRPTAPRRCRASRARP